MVAIDYWVYVDVVTKGVRLHKSTCGACRGGKGMHGHQQPQQVWWKGPFFSRDDAWKYAQSQAQQFRIQPTPCGLCHP